MSETGKSFSDALIAAKNGKKIYREGWNGKGMFVSLSPGVSSLPADSFWSSHNKRYAEENGGFAEVSPSLSFKNAQGVIVMGWVPSTGDMFWDDWVIE